MFFFQLRLRHCATFLASLCLLGEAAAQPFVNFEGKQTCPVRLSPDGSRLFAVNTPDNRLSVFDVSRPQNPILIAEIPVGLEPVSVNALNNEEVWVVNEVSDSISVVSLSRHVVTDTIYVKDEPADIAFANGRAFVTASRNNRITVVAYTVHCDSIVADKPRVWSEKRLTNPGLVGNYDLAPDGKPRSCQWRRRKRSRPRTKSSSC